MAVFQHGLQSPGRRTMAAARIEIDQVNIVFHKWLSLNGFDGPFMTVLLHEYEHVHIIKCVRLIRFIRHARQQKNTPPVMPAGLVSEDGRWAANNMLISGRWSCSHRYRARPSVR